MCTVHILLFPPISVYSEHTKYQFNSFDLFCRASMTCRFSICLWFCTHTLHIIHEWHFHLKILLLVLIMKQFANTIRLHYLWIQHPYDMIIHGCPPQRKPTQGGQLGPAGPDKNAPERFLRSIEAMCDCFQPLQASKWLFWQKQELPASGKQEVAGLGPEWTFWGQRAQAVAHSIRGPQKTIQTQPELCSNRFQRVGVALNPWVSIPADFSICRVSMKRTLRYWGPMVYFCILLPIKNKTLY